MLASIYAQGGGPDDVTGAIFVAGAVLAAIGVIIHYLGAAGRQCDPAANRDGRSRDADRLQPGTGGDQHLHAVEPWVAIITMTAVILMAVGLRGLSRSDRHLPRLDRRLPRVVDRRPHVRQDESPAPGQRDAWSARPCRLVAGEERRLARIPAAHADGLVGNQATAGNIDAVGWHLPSIHITFVLLVLPAVIALVAENVGHVKAVGEMTKRDLDPVMGRAVAADGIGTMITSFVGGSPPRPTRRTSA